MLRAFGLTDIGCVRQNNEDVFRLVDDAGLYIVADGVGGAEAGEVAAGLAADAVIDYVRRARAKTPLLLQNALKEAHQQVLAAAARDEELRGMGCAAAAALFDERSIFLANVGDSRAYVFSGQACEYMTSDQTWVNEFGRQLGLSAAELATHPLRHVLTVAVGSEGDFRVNSMTVPLKEDMRVLLCTDGLHDVVSNSDIVDIMIRRCPSDWKCRMLVEAAQNAGGPDNITVVVLQDGS